MEEQRNLMYQNEIHDIQSVIDSLISLRRKKTDLSITVIELEKTISDLNIEINKSNEKLDELKCFITTKEENKVREEYLDNKEKSIQEFHKQAFDMFDKAELLQNEVNNDRQRLEDEKNEFNFEQSSIYLYTKKIQEEINKGNKIDVVNFIKNINIPEQHIIIN